ncbi:hypothetical protein [Dyella sp. C11]|uniref:hypothetical protein n=1 Tax=Dyella sp. C11 TaxID=2126991 RepID=UPI00130057D4|nr:hypothetical protein [Dyella sp. C11]
MRGTTILCNPRSFPSFELAHRIESGGHRFEVAYGISFNELYYDFGPGEFLERVDRGELEKQLTRAGASWLPRILVELAEHPMKSSAADIRELAKMAAD